VFHRRYAGRLAWQKRAWLFLLLLVAAALAGWLLGRPLVVGLAFCAFLYPVRWEEPRALRAIDARGLAYRAWLEAGPDHPLAERLAEAARAEASRIPLPRFPWPELLIGALALTLAIFYLLGPASPPATTASGRPPVGAERGVAPKEGAAPVGEAGGGTPRASPASRASGGADAGKASAAEGVERNRPAGGEAAGSGESVPDAGGALGDRSPGGDGAPAGPAGGATAPAGAEGAPPRPAEAGRPAAGAGPGTGGAPPPAPPPAVAPRGRGLPSPWPGGRPPERVARRAESYLSELPLTPEERRWVARYFGLSAP